MSACNERIVHTVVSPLAALPPSPSPMKRHGPSPMSSKKRNNNKSDASLHHDVIRDDFDMDVDEEKAGDRVAARVEEGASCLMVTPSPLPAMTRRTATSVNIEDQQASYASKRPPKSVSQSLSNQEKQPVRRLFTDPGSGSDDGRTERGNSRGKAVTKAYRAFSDDGVAASSPQRRIFPTAATTNNYDRGDHNCEGRSDRPRRKRAASASVAQDSLISFFASAATDTNGHIVLGSHSPRCAPRPPSPRKRQRRLPRPERDEESLQRDRARGEDGGGTGRPVVLESTGKTKSIVPVVEEVATVATDDRDEVRANIRTGSSSASVTNSSSRTSTTADNIIPAHLVQLLAPPRGFQKKQPRSTREVLQEYYEKDKEQIASTKAQKGQKKGRRQQRNNRVTIPRSSTGSIGSRRILPRASKERAGMIFQQMSRYYFDDTSDDEDDAEQEEQRTTPDTETTVQSSSDSTSSVPLLPKLRPRTQVATRQLSRSLRHPKEAFSQPKRTRGRPRTTAITATDSSLVLNKKGMKLLPPPLHAVQTGPPKKKRGRPRKHPLPQVEALGHQPDDDSHRCVEDGASFVSERTQRLKHNASSRRVLPIRKTTESQVGTGDGGASNGTPSLNSVETATMNSRRGPRSKNYQPSTQIGLRNEHRAEPLPRVGPAVAATSTTSKSPKSPLRKLPPRHSFRCRPKFSMEEYSVYSSATPNLQKNQRDEFSSSSSGTAEDLPVMPVSENTTKTSRSSPKRKRSRHEQLPSISKRVRFDSEVTTFSVKIKIKTSLDPRRVDSRDNKRARSSSLRRTLSESAVQAIANQVTRACLSQATSAPSDSGTSNGIPQWKKVLMNEPSIQLDIQEESSSQSSDESSVSSKNNAGNGEDGLPKDVDSIQHGMEEKDRVDARRKSRRSCQRQENDDVRSILSELTGDWSKRSLSDGRDRRTARRFQPHIEKQHERSQSTSHSDKVSIRAEDDRSADSYGAHEDFSRHATFDEDVEHESNNGDHSIRSITISKQRPDTSSRSSVAEKGKTRPSPPKASRGQHRWHCEDSLAGSLADMSRNTAAGASTTPTMPNEVALQKQRSPRQSRLARNDGTNSRKASTPSALTNHEIDCEDIGEKKPAAISVSPQRRKSRLASFSPTSRCGKCLGCERSMDCQTCDVCLKRLRGHGSCPFSVATNGEAGGCLLRRCVRVRRVGHVDSLLSLFSSTGNNDTASKQKISKRLNTQQAPEDDKIEQEIGGRATGCKDPWEDGDDWSVDYSYLSEPEHRRRWETTTKAATTLSRKSQPEKLFTPSSFLRPQSHDRKTGFHHGGPTSASSVSASCAMPSQPQLQPSNSKPAARGRGRGAKNRKFNPLHGMALPAPGISEVGDDAASIASWRENRNCLRALMTYDEADQEWI